jgi:hypothetical protein
MPFRPPLTHEDLAKIRTRYEITPGRAPCSYQDAVVWRDVITLLYEVKRLRALTLTAHQLRDNIKQPGSCLDVVWREFLEQLATEPCVLEQGDLKDDLLGKPKRRVKPNGP